MLENDRDPNDSHTSPKSNSEGLRIDPELGVDITRVPVAFREDSHPQAILKFQLAIASITMSTTGFKECYDGIKTHEI